MSGVRFFAVCLALGVVAVLLAAALFDLALLHGKVDAVISAGPSTALEDNDSGWRYEAPAPPPPVPVTPAPEFPPVIVEKTVVLEKIADTPAGSTGVPPPPWWCAPAAGLGFDPEACRKAETPLEAPSGPKAWIPVPAPPSPIKADEAGPPPVVGLPRVTIEKAPDDTPLESVK